jgi:pyruvate-ferredoxin/flavodoxin oxidoreductase
VKPTDVIGAIALVEGSTSQRVLVAVDGLDLAEHNAYGERVAVEHGTDAASMAKRAAQTASDGERVAVVARAVDLAAARGELARIASRGLPVVVHAIAEPGAPGAPACESGIAPALTLGDLPWGMLLGAGVGDALDLALVARRAAEDSGCPFLVVHERPHTHLVEPVAAPSRELIDAFLGGPRPAGQPQGGTSERAFAERAPFALASAMRELESLTARRHDVIERVPNVDAAIALVGVGALGDSIVADVERQRGAGHDVAAVRVVAWRPFPGARLVKALCRALAITVLEGVDRPLAANGPLAVQLKAAFADALTWAPDYPGIGRIPRIVTGVVAQRRELDASDLDAVVHNMLADERGRRTFVVGGDPGTSLEGPTVERAEPLAFAMRGLAARREVAVAGGELCALVLASVLGLRTRVAVRSLADDEGGGFAFDLLAGRERPRGAHAPHALRVVAVGDAAQLARGNALARLAPGGLAALPTAQRAADAVWAEVPSWAKAVVFDRNARLVGWSPAPPSAGAWLEGAAFVGIALAAAGADRALAAGRAVDGAVVEREVAEALRRVAPGAATSADAGASSSRGAPSTRTSRYRALRSIARTTACAWGVATPGRAREAL